MDPGMFFVCIIVSVLIGAALFYVATLCIAHFIEPKKTLVLRDAQGRLEGIIET